MTTPAERLRAGLAAHRRGARRGDRIGTSSRGVWDSELVDALAGIGGVVGAGILVAGTVVEWSDRAGARSGIPMVTSPFVGSTFGLSLKAPSSQSHDLPTQAIRARVGGGFRHAQSVSACAMAMGHGMQDAQKDDVSSHLPCSLISMGYASASATRMPVWIVFACAGAISLGNGSRRRKRIMKTLGQAHHRPRPGTRTLGGASSRQRSLYVTSAPGSTPLSQRRK